MHKTYAHRTCEGVAEMTSRRDTSYRAASTRRFPELASDVIE